MSNKTLSDLYQGPVGIPNPLKSLKASTDKVYSLQSAWEEYRRLIGKATGGRDNAELTHYINAGFVRIPGLSSEQQAEFRRLVQLFTSEDTYKRMPEGERLRPLRSYYSQFTDPYGDLSSLTACDPEAVARQLEDAGYTMGYKIVKGFEMGSAAKWAIRIAPYNPDVPGRYTLVPELPRYLIPSSSTSFISAFQVDYGSNPPITDWSLSGMRTNSEDLKLYRDDGSFKVFAGRNSDLMLDITILDDIYFSLDKYLKEFLNKIYDIKTGCMAPYWATLFLIDLTVFRGNYDINMRTQLICSLSDYSFNYVPGSDARTVNLQFDVNGIVAPNQSKVFGGKLSGNKSDLSWKDVNFINHV